MAEAPVCRIGFHLAEDRLWFYASPPPTRHQHKPADSQFLIDEHMRRKRAVEEAKKSKVRLKYIIEKAARDSPDFINATNGLLTH